MTKRLLVAACLAGLAGAQDVEMRELSIPWEFLQLKDGFALVEGGRGAFPRLAVRPAAEPGAKPVALAPATLAKFLKKPPARAEAAFEAVATFVPGLVLDDEAAAKRVLAAAGRTQPVDQPLAPSVEQRGKGYRVTCVAIEVSARARVTRIAAVIDEAGKVERTTTALAECARTALPELLRAARIKRTPLQAWAAIRNLATVPEMTAAFGKVSSDARTGKDRHSWQWPLEDGSFANVFTKPDEPRFTSGGRVEFQTETTGELETLTYHAYLLDT